MSQKEITFKNVHDGDAAKVFISKTTGDENFPDDTTREELHFNEEKECKRTLVEDEVYFLELRLHGTQGSKMTVSAKGTTLPKAGVIMSIVPHGDNPAYGSLTLKIKEEKKDA